MHHSTQTIGALPVVAGATPTMDGGGDVRGPVGLVLAGLLAGTLVAGCSAGSHPVATSADPTTTTAALGKPRTPRAQLLVTAADFPAGAVIQQISPAELTRAQHQLTQSLAGAKIEPAQCGARQVDLARAMADMQAKTSTVVAQNPSRGVTYAVGVVDDAEDLGRFRDSVLGPCADIATSMTTPSGRVAETGHTAAVPVPAGLGADQAIAYQTTTTVTAPARSGRTSTTQSMNGYAVLRGMSVEVRVNSLTGPIPPQEFNTLFTTAVTKLHNAT